MSYANATALSVKSVPQNGSVNIATLQTPDGTNGNKFLCNGRTVFRAKNTGAGAITLTFETPGTIAGLAISDLTVNVPATTGDVLVEMDGNFFQPGTQDVFVSYSGVTGLTVDVYRLD